MTHKASIYLVPQPVPHPVGGPLSAFAVNLLDVANPPKPVVVGVVPNPEQFSHNDCVPGEATYYKNNTDLLDTHIPLTDAGYEFPASLAPYAPSVQTAINHFYAAHPDPEQARLFVTISKSIVAGGQSQRGQRPHWDGTRHQFENTGLGPNPRTNRAPQSYDYFVADILPTRFFSGGFDANEIAAHFPQNGHVGLQKFLDYLYGGNGVEPLAARATQPWQPKPYEIVHASCLLPHQGVANESDDPVKRNFMRVQFNARTTQPRP